MLRKMLLLSAMLLLGGCANGYKQFYQPVNAVVTAPRSGAVTANPSVDHIPNASPAVLANYERQGYMPIGYSSFNSGRPEPDANAIEQGRAVGADLVLIVNPQYTGTMMTSIPITTPTTSTAYSTGTATAYGPYGMVNAYGSGTTTTYGTQTTYMPLAIHRVNYGAVYLVKRHFLFGAIMRELNDAERQAIQSNKGAVVQLVVNGSSAFNADILPGDIITAADGQPILSMPDFSQYIGAHAGQSMTLDIIRGAQRIQKTVQLAQ